MNYLQRAEELERKYIICIQNLELNKENEADKLIEELKQKAKKLREEIEGLSEEMIKYTNTNYFFERGLTEDEKEALKKLNKIIGDKE